MIAVPITAETVEAALVDIRKANSKADAIELRLDFLRELNETILKELLQECKKPVIVTFRNKNYGASIECTERMFLLKKAIDFNADYIDLDFDTEKEFINEIAEKKGNTKIILSHHDFNETLPLHSLLQLLQSMLSIEAADVLKIVTYAKDEKDNDTIFALIRAAKAFGKPIIAFCMGPKGRKSRIESIKMGAFLTFASLGRGKESAAGQLTVAEMQEELEK